MAISPRNEMDFRRLTETDLPLALAMNRDFRSGIAQEEALHVFLADPECWLFAAVKDGRIIGFAYGYALQRLNTDKKMLYIHEVGIMEEYQRQGIGTLLMDRLKADCKAENFCKIFLICDQKNTGANALYRKTGGETSVESQGNDTVYWWQIS